MQGRSTDIGLTKPYILHSFHEFCKENSLLSDSAYSDLITTIIMDQLESGQLESILNSLSITLAPYQIQKRKQLKDNLIKSFIKRIFMRLLTMAQKNQYDLLTYFSLCADKDPIPNGVRGRDIQNIVKYEDSILNTLDTDFYKVESVTELWFDEPLKNVSLLSDAVETVTGISNGVVTVGDKITSGSIVYTKGASPFLITSHSLFTYGSLAINGLDFILIPAGYIFRYVTKRTVPFNQAHNIRWLLAGLALTLAIISIAIPPTAVFISFTSATIGLLTSAYTLGKLFYDDYKIRHERSVLSDKIDKTASKIQLAQRNASKTRKEICQQLSSKNPNPERIDTLKRQLDQINHNYAYQCNKLKGYYKLRKRLKLTQNRQQSPIEKIDTSTRVVLAAMVITGTILSINPLTAIIGVSLIATAAVISFTAFVTKKICQVIRTKRERQAEMQLENSIVVDRHSTSHLLNTLRHTNELNPLNDFPIQATTIENKLLEIIHANNKPGILEFFLALEKEFISLNLMEEEINNIFNDINPETTDSASDLFKNVLNDIDVGKIFLHDRLKHKLATVKMLASQFDKHDITVDFNIVNDVMLKEQAVNNYIEDYDVNLNRRNEIVR